MLITTLSDSLGWPGKDLRKSLEQRLLGLSKQKGPYSPGISMWILLVDKYISFLITHSKIEEMTRGP